MLLSIIRYGVVKLHAGVHNEKWARPAVEVLGFALAILLGILIHRHFAGPTMTIVQTTPDTKTVTVAAPTITSGVVEKIITDPNDKKLIAQLMATNTKLQLNVVQLTSTVAELKSHGGTGTPTGGTITPVVTSKPSDSEGFDAQSYQFKDWRLFATYSKDSFSYDLNQKFNVVTTTGKDKDGKRTQLVQLFEQGPNGERTAVPAETIAIIADETAPHWMTHLNVQGGLAVTPSGRGGIVGLQWLKRGSSPAPADIAFAVATPVLFLSSDVQEFGILPISMNVGRIKHQPFTNIWLSPYVGVGVAPFGISRIGFALTATF